MPAGGAAQGAVKQLKKMAIRVVVVSNFGAKDITMYVLIALH